MAKSEIFSQEFKMDWLWFYKLVLLSLRKKIIDFQHYNPPHLREFCVVLFGQISVGFRQGMEFISHLYTLRKEFTHCGPRNVYWVCVQVPPPGEIWHKSDQIKLHGTPLKLFEPDSLDQLEFDEFPI